MAETRDRMLLLERFFQRPDDYGTPFSSHYAFFEEGDGKVDPVRAAVMELLPPRLTFSHNERQQRRREYIDGETPKEVSVFVDRLVRFILAITGGLFLIVPMIIMSIKPSTTKSLVTVSSFLILFSLVLALGIKVSNIETLVSTATYAAVLVVFVGTGVGVES